MGPIKHKLKNFWILLRKGELLQLPLSLLLHLLLHLKPWVFLSPINNIPDFEQKGCHVAVSNEILVDLKGLDIYFQNMGKLKATHENTMHVNQVHLMRKLVGI